MLISFQCTLVDDGCQLSLPSLSASKSSALFSRLPVDATHESIINALSLLIGMETLDEIVLKSESNAIKKREVGILELED